MTLEAVEHAALLTQAAAGDQAAWDEIVRRFSPLLWSVGRAHRLDHETTVDVAQLTWLRLLENLDRIDDPARLPGWLATTARRECLAVLRRKGREQPGWEADDTERVADTVELDLLLLTDERDRVVWRCFADLTERCQRLLRIVVAAEAVSYAEVSEALGVPVGSIGPTRGRCLDRLRQLLVASAYPFDTAPAVP